VYPKAQGPVKAPSRATLDLTGGRAVAPTESLPGEAAKSGLMSPKARREYLSDMRPRYAAAPLPERTALLDEVVTMTGYHRKYAIALLGREPRAPGKRRRRVTYGPPVTAALAAIWEAAGCPWSARLKAMLPLWLPWLQKRTAVDWPTHALLMRISTRSIDRLLAPKRALVQRRRNSLTHSGLWVAHQIPIRSERWNVSEPGWLEIDLVAHCGESAAGEFIYSLNATDIATGWTETRALLGKGRHGITAALNTICEYLPFALLGIDSDSGREFINAHVLSWCRARAIEFTRSRPYKKNDNAHIEQKNWTHVRKIFGWLRFDSLQALDAMNALYTHEIRLWMNYFQPSVKLVRKERIGSRIRKLYDAPQTPYDRLAALGRAGERPQVDPFDLGDRIGCAIENLCGQASHGPLHRRNHPLTQFTIPPRRHAHEYYVSKMLAGAIGQP